MRNRIKASDMREQVKFYRQNTLPDGTDTYDLLLDTPAHIAPYRAWSAQGGNPQYAAEDHYRITAHETKIIRTGDFAEWRDLVLEVKEIRMDYASAQTRIGCAISDLTGEQISGK